MPLPERCCPIGSAGTSVPGGGSRGLERTRRQGRADPWPLSWSRTPSTLNVGTLAPWLWGQAAPCPRSYLCLQQRPSTPHQLPESEALTRTWQHCQLPSVSRPWAASVGSLGLHDGASRFPRRLSLSSLHQSTDLSICLSSCLSILPVASASSVPPTRRTPSRTASLYSTNCQLYLLKQKNLTPFFDNMVSIFII